MFLENYLNPLSPYFALVVIIMAILPGYILAKFTNKNSIITHNKFHTLDGIRGYLALAVFAHHSVIWYCRVHGQNWDDVKSNFYVNLGQASVAIFFMITAFLFFGKLLNAKEKKIDWYRLYISRILRLFPLHIVVSLVMVLIVLICTNFSFNEPWHKFVIGLLKFLQFKAPILNGIDTGAMISNVTWTLRFERSFYIALPVFAFLLRLNVSPTWFLITAAATIDTIFGDVYFISPCFIGGIIAAFVIKHKFHLDFFRTKAFGLFAILCLIFELSYFKSPYNPVALMVLFIFFIAIICDNPILKFCSYKFSQFLSTISYSVYLLHGLVMFLILKVLLGDAVVRSLSLLQYWSVIGLSGIILILLSSLTYHFIELPFLNLAKSKNLYKPDFIKFISFSRANK